MNNVRGGKLEGRSRLFRVCCYSPLAPSINPDDRFLKSLKNTRESRYRIPNTKDISLQSKKLVFVMCLSGSSVFKIKTHLVSSNVVVEHRKSQRPFGLK